MRLLLVVLLLAGCSSTTGTPAPAPPAPAPPVYGARAPALLDHPVPAGARWVGPAGDDTGPGTRERPWRTLGHATATATAGTTLVLRSGTYRESVSVFGKRLLVQSAPGERVTLTGSDPVTGWVPDGDAFRVDGWRSALTQRERPDLVDPAHPLAARPDMVFVDGVAQEQVATRAAVRPGSFFVDGPGSRLVLGSDPTGREVEAATRSRGLYLNQAHGSAVRGIAFTRYGNHPDELGALLDEADDSVVEDCVFSQNAGIGLSVLGDRVRVDRVTASDNGQIGLHAHRADGLQVTRSLLHHNDTERFAVEGAQGNLKVTRSRGVRVATTLSRDSVGRGLWFDLDTTGVQVVDNVVTGSGDRGVQVELSDGAVVAGNLVTGNAADGVAVVASRDVEVVHNSFWGNRRAVNVVADGRRDVARVALRNNVVTGAAQLVAVEDVTRARSAQGMGVTADHDAYAQVGEAVRPWFGWADYPRPYPSYDDLAAFRAATGQETDGVGVRAPAEPFFVDAAGGDFRLRPGGAAASLRATTLSARAVAALGAVEGLPVGARVVTGFR